MCYYIFVDTKYCQGEYKEMISMQLILYVFAWKLFMNCSDIVWMNTLDDFMCAQSMQLCAAASFSIINIHQGAIHLR
jgi:hypothetical protein